MTGSLHVFGLAALHWFDVVASGHHQFPNDRRVALTGSFVATFDPGGDFETKVFISAGNDDDERLGFVGQVTGGPNDIELRISEAQWRMLLDARFSSRKSDLKLSAVADTREEEQSLDVGALFPVMTYSMSLSECQS